MAHILSQMLAEANFGHSPAVVVNGHVDATFAYLPVHLDFILFELLKNAFRATLEHARARTRRPAR
jgi:26S proteasome regulatory subunit T1